jgi:hypothetical protein
MTVGNFPRFLYFFQRVKFNGPEEGSGEEKCHFNSATYKTKLCIKTNKKFDLN